jgi:predicted cobalt transporter CbtA
MATTPLDRVDPTRLRSLAVVAALVGLLAGLVGATFAFVAGEPAVDDAIAIEEANAAADPDPGDEAHEEGATVDRRDQRGFGLFAGYALTGAAFGALLALTAHSLGRGRPDALSRVLIAGAVLAGGFTVAPWLKYPPNPPAVGDPDTLADRQRLYVATIVIAILVGLAATALARRLREAGWADHRRLPAVAAAVAVPMLVAFAAMPPAPDEVPVPATLVWRFRLASLGANLALWAVLTLGVGWVVGEAARRRATRGGSPALTGTNA